MSAISTDPVPEGRLNSDNQGRNFSRPSGTHGSLYFHEKPAMNCRPTISASRRDTLDSSDKLAHMPGTLSQRLPSFLSLPGSAWERIPGGSASPFWARRVRRKEELLSEVPCLNIEAPTTHKDVGNAPGPARRGVACYALLDVQAAPAAGLRGRGEACVARLDGRSTCRGIPGQVAATGGSHQAAVLTPH